MCVCDMSYVPSKLPYVRIEYDRVIPTQNLSFTRNHKIIFTNFQLELFIVAIKISFFPSVRIKNPVGNKHVP